MHIVANITYVQFLTNILVSITSWFIQLTNSPYEDLISENVGAVLSRGHSFIYE